MKTIGTKILTALVIVATIIIVIGLAYSYHLEKIQNPESSYNYSELIRSCLQVMTCLIASLSLIFTVDSRNENIKMKSEDRKTELELEWYKTIIVQRHIKSLFEFFNFSCSIINTFKSINERQTLEDMKHSEYNTSIKTEVVLPFTEKYIQIQQPLVSDAYIVDNELGHKLKDEFSIFQDEFTSYIQNTQPNYEQMKNMILETQKNMIKVLKDYNLKIVK